MHGERTHHGHHVHFVGPRVLIRMTAARWCSGRPHYWFLPCGKKVMGSIPACRGPFCAELAWAPFDCEGSFRVLLQSKNICVWLICKSKLAVRVGVSMRGCKWTFNELQGVTPINRECTNHTGQPHPHRSGQSH